MLNNSGNPTDDESMDMIDCNETNQNNSTNLESGNCSKNSTIDGNGNNNTNIKRHKKSSGNKKSNKRQTQRKNNVHHARHKSCSNPQQQQPQQKLTATQQWDSELTAKVYATMKKYKEVFFVVRLHSSQSAATLPPINDLDAPLSCDLMDGRDAFLTLAREKHYEFSSLRRAKFSSLAMLYELHNSSNDRFVNTCNTCKRHLVETRYHCTQCDHFDLCVACYQRDGHHHPMDKLGFGDLVGGVAGEDGAVPGGSGGVAGSGGDIDGTGDASGGGSSTTSPGESRRLSIQRCIQSLVHACQCRDTNCRLSSCHKMKRVVQHAKSCKRKSNQQGGAQPAQTSGCPICKQLIALCSYHAKHCQEQRCPVPYCINIKHKLKQQQLQVLQPQQRLMAPQQQPPQQMYQQQQPPPQRYWPQTQAQQPQRGALLRSPPQRLPSPRYNVMLNAQQSQADPSDMLLFQQQPDFGASQHQQQQELTPQDQLTKFVENL